MKKHRPRASIPYGTTALIKAADVMENEEVQRRNCSLNSRVPEICNIIIHPRCPKIAALAWGCFITMPTVSK